MHSLLFMASTLYLLGRGSMHSICRVVGSTFPEYKNSKCAPVPKRGIFPQAKASRLPCSSSVAPSLAAFMNETPGFCKSFFWIHKRWTTHRWIYNSIHQTSVSDANTFMIQTTLALVPAMERSNLGIKHEKRQSASNGKNSCYLKDIRYVLEFALLSI